MFAVVRTGGKQYRVAAGDKIVVEKLDGEAGDTITLGDVLLAGEGAELKSTDGLTVAAEIIAQAKADKVIVFKKRRRHNYRRKNGHRQQHTILQDRRDRRSEGRRSREGQGRSQGAQGALADASDGTKAAHAPAAEAPAAKAAKHRQGAEAARRSLRRPPAQAEPAARTQAAAPPKKPRRPRRPPPIRPPRKQSGVDRPWHIRKQAARPATAATAQSKRLGVKKFGGETVRRRQHHRAPARHQMVSGRQRRHRQGSYPVRAYRRPRRVPRRQARPQIRAHYADMARSASIGTVRKGPFPRGGGPDEISKIETTREKREAPLLSLLSFGSSPEMSRAAARRPRKRRRCDVREDTKTAAEARLPEDAPALAAAIADEAIVRNLASVPWPYSVRDAEAFLASSARPGPAPLLIFERGAGAPQLVGACGLGRRPSGSVELGYWIARPSGAAVMRPRPAPRSIDIARALGLKQRRRLAFPRQPGIGRVLEKLGFAPARHRRPANELRPRRARARAPDASRARCRRAGRASGTESARRMTPPPRARSGRGDHPAVIRRDW